MRSINHHGQREGRSWQVAAHNRSFPEDMVYLPPALFIMVGFLCPGPDFMQLQSQIVRSLPKLELAVSSEVRQPNRAQNPH
jgi:hypothetical protein